MTPNSKVLSERLAEARKYKLNLTIAHQFVGQLEEDIKAAKRVEMAWNEIKEGKFKEFLKEVGRKY